MAFTQSSLAKKTIPTTKYSSRGSITTITKITWHHMAGKMTAEACAKMHASGTRQASANYYIGYNGEIVAGVLEQYRAWTSSSSWNDSRAITIEVSNSSGKPNWEVSDAVIDSLVKLCADICRRYCIIPYFNGTKDASFTLHNMFQATECPGPYLKKNIPIIKSSPAALRIQISLLMSHHL